MSLFTIIAGTVWLCAAALLVDAVCDWARSGVE